MTANLIPFEFESQSVRIIERGNEPWFVLADVCRVLEIANSRDAAARLDDDEKGVVTTDTLGGPQDVTIINESGLYSLILTSRKPSAKR
jgi:prophage antirepressor-like protein